MTVNRQESTYTSHSARADATTAGFVTNPHDPAREREYVGLVIREIEIRANTGHAAGLAPGEGSGHHLPWWWHPFLITPPT